MNDFLKMDVFFLVSTLAVIVIAGLLAFALVRVLRILRRVEEISETVSDEAVLVRADVAEMRANVKQEGFKMLHLARFARKTASRFMGEKKK
ncbi:MAG: hypothetical protein JWM46_179 [Candidatus Kaiserbacteria bacterium]|nr:hypothetical protein [Candidatus Kaiserbacteria bacterium]